MQNEANLHSLTFEVTKFDNEKGFTNAESETKLGQKFS